MDAARKLLRFKCHILSAAIVGSFLASLYYVAPNFVTVVAYFWPLLLSTALFLAAVVFFGRSAPLEPDKNAGGELLEYVAGTPEEVASEESEKWQ